jgi:hypothetical protein
MMIVPRWLVYQGEELMIATGWYTHKTSGFKTSGFQTSGFKTYGFKMSCLQNVRFTKRQVSKPLVSRRQILKHP